MRFFARAKHWKMLLTENGFLKNDFPEIILRRKLFYVETNGALVYFHFPLSFFHFIVVASILQPLLFIFIFKLSYIRSLIFRYAK
jgi:hypothetical protein